MDAVAQAKRDPVPENFSDAEWQVRVDLAACYRLIARFGWDLLVYNHNSALIPGAGKHFLLNPFGLMFHEITASSLVKVDLDGRIVGAGDYGLNAAAPIIHTPFYKHREDVGCVIHMETDAGTGVSCQKDGLLPLTQTAMAIYDMVAYHDFEGFALDFGECERLAADADDKNVIFLRNHGTLVLGPTVAAAFHLAFAVEQACRAQIAAQSGGAELVIPPREVRELTAAQGPLEIEEEGRAWAALIRLLDREDPSYRE